MMKISCMHEADKLPAVWDELAENYFQRIAFLIHSEKYNSCRQRYYLGIEEGKLVAAAIVYSLRLDLLTYLKLKSPLTMHIVGIPCSVSSPGIFGNKQAMEEVKNHILKVEKGLVLILNLKEKHFDASRISLKTLPTVVMSHHYTDWQDYIISLRTGYRRRLNLINRPDSEVRFEKMQCSGFTETMYQQYLEVLKRSSGKLEKLTVDFFRNLPSDFLLTACYRANNVIGWNIALADHDKYWFFLGGIDYNHNKKCHTYLRLLSTIVKDGIDCKSAFIELGQTAEIPKMRMGGKPIPLFMEAHHTNSFFNKLIKLSGSLLEYTRKLENTHSLKEENV